MARCYYCSEPEGKHLPECPLATKRTVTHAPLLLALVALAGCVRADVIEACGKACASQGGIDVVNADTCICRKAAK